MSGEDTEVMNDVFASDRDRLDDDVSSDGDQPRDELGRWARKEEEQPAPEPAPEAQPTEEPKPSSEPEPDRRVPLSELQSERRKRQELEAALAQRDQFYAQQLQQLRQPQMQQPQQPLEAPDIFDDPDAYLDQKLTPLQQQQQQMQIMVENTRLDMSEDRAREKFGDDTVNQAVQAAQQMGILGNFASGRHPYQELVQWYQQANVIQQTGGDLDAYRNKIREEILQELRQGKSPGQPQQRFPTSLADQTAASGGNGPAMTQQGVLDDIFHTDRNRRA